MSIVEPLADQLERQFGSCPAPRRAFLSWVDDQLERCARLGVPGEVAQQMIETGYVEWCALLLERDQPEDQEREPLDLKISGDFDEEDPEINAMFEGKYEKGD